MKLLIILLFLSFNCFAVNHYIAKSDRGVCGKMQYSGPLAKQVCEKTNAECIQVKNYNCNFHIAGKVEVDDFEKPKFTKNDIEDCTAENCITIFETKICTDLSETAILNLDLFQVYCSKPNGYHQKEIDGIVIDSAKKVIHEAEKQSNIDKRLAARNERQQIKAMLLDIDSDSTISLNVKKVLKRLIKDMRD